MKRMMYFHVQNNSLTSVPSSLCNLEFLIVLALNGNHLTSLPANIGDLKRTLVKLEVSRNNLTAFPPSFLNLENLEQLDARNNSLTSLPPWNKLAKLQHLTVAGNPLCTNGWVGSGRVKELMEKEGEGCTPQCSDMCLNTYLENEKCG